MKKTIENKANKTQITDKFWGHYLEVVRDQVIPYQWEALNDRIPGASPSHAIENFKIAAGEAEGEYYGMVFQDSDVAKWLEAVAFSLENHPNEELERTADEVIALLGRAQGEDGYLNTYYTVKEPNKRWTNVRDNHELYCAGHLIEAAVAYFKATGKREFLDIMSRYADYIDNVFGPEEKKLKGYPGHQEIELALVKLYEVTNNEKYLNLSKYFIDERGKQPHYFDIEKKNREDERPFWFNNDYAYHQAHQPVREQDNAVGHAVRATYMYTAMADLAAKIGDEELKKASERLWENVTQKQMYVTGGIGSMVFGEAFSFDYDLPNDLSYTETCASIALVFWANRMLNLEANSKYADVMETALYNGTISGMDLDGKKFFYVNPLEVLPEASEKRNDKKHVKAVRQPWFGCACCPPNLARLIASIGHYIYSQKEKELFVHLYMGNETTVEVDGTQVQVIQKTDYPWDGNVSIQINPEKEQGFTLALRIPGWAKGATVKINGEGFDHIPLIKNGYVYINRKWKAEDTVELVLPMVIERIQSNPQVRQNVGKVALQRGPIVYCLEQVDNDENLHGFLLPRDAELTAEFVPDLLDGVVVISGEAERIVEADWNSLYRPVSDQTTPVQIKAVPYYAWCNREPGEMIVWINEKR
ncbi:glycoside hydrolase family 127 protein [Metabacillus halosaccharovorans]|uniref:Glycoside hydrolase family 127 protein n=1 Tax=Metabacillus halosaccharovorans TaxID=930124 RepID=A0ABT3DAY9_9BACI|nr:beta-L-arabinofuranosidase domain-containing protein [Metabacillus halosaccharovorans]MCV9884102.1 glycoside hydrolase family 127 protein [Metabacillus halosaccharovorans]